MTARNNGLKANLAAAHKAFEKHIKESFTLLDVFTEYTLEKNEYGRYHNLSVSMEWGVWYSGWRAALRHARRSHA